MSFTGRTNCTALSPLTDGLLSSNAGGGFVSRHLAATGYGAIELAGASDELVVLHVRDDGVEFEAVPGLAGATVSETTDYLDDEHDIPSDRTAVIGPAGERSPVRVDHDDRGARVRPRRVGRGPRIEERQGRHVRRRFGADLSINATANEIHREAATEDHIMKEQGTVAVMDPANEMDGLPSYYFFRALLRGRRGDQQRRGRRGRSTRREPAPAARSPASSRPATRRAASRPKAPSSRWRWRSARTRGVDDIVDVMESNRLCDEYGLDDLRGQHDRRVPRRRRRVRQSRAYLGPRGQDRPA